MHIRTHVYTGYTHKHALKCCTAYKLNEGENSLISHSEAHLIEIQNSKIAMVSLREMFEVRTSI